MGGACSTNGGEEKLVWEIPTSPPRGDDVGDTHITPPAEMIV
jgi:hypothetical protein